MISAVLAQHYHQFSSMARAWLSAGASSFSVWQHDQLLAAWPDPDAPQPASLEAPIAIEERVLGRLSVSGLGGPQVAARLGADAGLVTSLVQQAERLREANALLTESHDQLLAISESMGGIYNHESVEQLMRWLSGEAMRLVGARGGFVLLVPPATPPILVSRPTPHLSEEQIWQLYWRLQADSQLGKPGAPAPPDLPAGVRNILLAQVSLEQGGGLLLGLLNRGRGAFTARDYQMARTLARQAGARVEHLLAAEERFVQTRLQAEIELARRVQALLMPQRLPSVAGLDIHGRARPALPVGGDFYDFIEHPGRPFVFSVGDVVGKGLSAAMLMTMTRGAIHSKASFMPDPTPASVVRNSNIDLCEDFNQVGTFATVVVGQYRPERRELLFANAGHSPVIYRPAGGRPELLRAQSTALGLLALNHCENQALSLGPGDLLVVGTDGLSDARNARGAMFGYERLLELVDEHAGQPAAAISDALFEAVDSFAGSFAQDDDQTLVVIKGVET